MKSKASCTLKQVSARRKTKPKRRFRRATHPSAFSHNTRSLNLITQQKISALVATKRRLRAATAAFAMVQREAEGFETLQDLDAGGGERPVEEEDDVDHPDLRHSFLRRCEAADDHVAEVFIRKIPHRADEAPEARVPQRNQEDAANDSLAKEP
ncbi:unnamed protein product [Spirodela intermedia]|uniref:Uncharacterized protein n=1 Tax=Spirodela intermedia TaxID=51605 RepID=A0A7I8J1X3_SPIIN|nr:unnamed protein product [Spirodela intermedia]CAA6664137.1 unnamed protein product [Spirodela intermedia]